jgi:hypothetical protein
VHLVRAPSSSKKLVYFDGQKAVSYRSKMNRAPKRNFEALDPLEGLARSSGRLPDTGEHRTHFVEIPIGRPGGRSAPAAASLW